MIYAEHVRELDDQIGVLWNVNQPWRVRQIAINVPFADQLHLFGHLFVNFLDGFQFGLESCEVDALVDLLRSVFEPLVAVPEETQIVHGHV